MDSVEICPICLEELPVYGATVTECGHAFHTACLDLWLSSTWSCPLCRDRTANSPPAPSPIRPSSPTPPLPPTLPSSPSGSWDSDWTWSPGRDSDWTPEPVPYFIPETVQLQLPTGAVLEYFERVLGIPVVPGRLPSLIHRGGPDPHFMLWWTRFREPNIPRHLITAFGSVREADSEPLDLRRTPDRPPRTCALCQLGIGSESGNVRLVCGDSYHARCHARWQLCGMRHCVECRARLVEATPTPRVEYEEPADGAEYFYTEVDFEFWERHRLFRFDSVPSFFGAVFQAFRIRGVRYAVQIHRD